MDGWLDRRGLANRATDRLDALSHGNQQRVQLIAALVGDPDLLVLNEPFSGLDPIAMDAMSGLLAELAFGGATVLFSSTGWWPGGRCASGAGHAPSSSHSR